MNEQMNKWKLTRREEKEEKTEDESNQKLAYKHTNWHFK